MFVNLTPHAITLQAADGTRFSVRPRRKCRVCGEIDWQGDGNVRIPLTEGMTYSTPECKSHDFEVLPARIDSTPGVCEFTLGAKGFDAGIAIYSRTAYGLPAGIPDCDPNGVNTYIVSALFAGRVGDRIDVVYPGTGPADGCIRENGQVVAVTRLIRA